MSFCQSNDPESQTLIAPPRQSMSTRARVIMGLGVATILACLYLYLADDIRCYFHPHEADCRDANSGNDYSTTMVGRVFGR